MNRLLLILVFTCSFSLFSQDEYIFKAMEDEAKRSLSELGLDGLEKPYFIEYRLEITDFFSARSTLGSIVDAGANKLVRLSVGVRVGDYNFDNTNYLDFGLSLFGSSDDEERFKRRALSREIDYKSLRRELWLATDAAYKQSAEIYSKKVSALQNRIMRDTLPDFIKADATVFNDKNISNINPNQAELNKLINSLSGVFANYKEIYNSSVSIENVPKITYYYNTEGTKLKKQEMYCGLEIAAYSVAEDGMPITDFYACYAENTNSLPSKDSLLKVANHIATNIQNTLKSKVLDEPYSGPILFSGQAAGELLAQAFAPNFVQQRAIYTETATQNPERFAALQNKVGARVLPDFISVQNDPTTNKFQSYPLLGSFAYDDEGIKAQKLNIVENGDLKALLNSRLPSKKVRKSNGNFREGGAMYSNLIFTSDKGKSNQQLKQDLIELIKKRDLPYGIIVTKVVNSNILFTSLYRVANGNLKIPKGEGNLVASEAYKIFPDGKLELIKGLELNNFVARTFKDIVAVGNNYYVHNLLASSVIPPFFTGGSQYLLSSIVSPDLLFEDAEAKSIEDDFKKPPILTNPISEK